MLLLKSANSNGDNNLVSLLGRLSDLLPGMRGLSILDEKLHFGLGSLVVHNSTQAESA